MEKIKIMSDTACDIPGDIGKELDIELIPIPITVDGKSYLEGVDFTFTEFYDLLLGSDSLPFTSHITAPAFAERFVNAYNEGYNRIICTTINSKGSSMFEAATIGKEFFYEQFPNARGVVEIAVLDSRTYSMAYGMPLMMASDMRKKGSSFSEIVAFLTGAFESMEVYFTVFDLDFAKRSGRISAAAALVGGMLGLRPVLAFIDGDNKIISKVRGDKPAVGELANIAEKRKVMPGSPYVVLTGTEDEYAQSLSETLAAKIGYPPIGTFKIGSCVAINSGPKVVGVAFLTDKN